MTFIEVARIKGFSVVTFADETLITYLSSNASAWGGSPERAAILPFSPLLCGLSEGEARWVILTQAAWVTFTQSWTVLTQRVLSLNSPEQPCKNFLAALNADAVALCVASSKGNRESGIAVALTASRQGGSKPSPLLSTETNHGESIELLRRMGIRLRCGLSRSAISRQRTSLSGRLRTIGSGTVRVGASSPPTWWQFRRWHPSPWHPSPECLIHKGYRNLWRVASWVARCGG